MTAIEFTSRDLCEQARYQWLRDVPRTPDRKYWTLNGIPYAVCVQK